jgi:hypothetical protein
LTTTGRKPRDGHQVLLHGELLYVLREMLVALSGGRDVHEVDHSRAHHGHDFERRVAQIQVRRGCHAERDRHVGERSETLARHRCFDCVVAHGQEREPVSPIRIGFDRAAETRRGIARRDFRAADRGLVAGVETANERSVATGGVRNLRRHDEESRNTGSDESLAVHMLYLP